MNVYRINYPGSFKSDEYYLWEEAVQILTISGTNTRRIQAVGGYSTLSLVIL